MTSKRVVAALFAFVLLGCKGTAEAPEVAFGTDRCAKCDRVIEGPEFAAVASSEEGEVKAFDRATCLIRDLPELEPWRVWFHDHDGEEWIEGSNAVFVISRERAGAPIRRIAAFATEEAASAYYARMTGRNEMAEGYDLLRTVVEQHP